MQVSMCERGTGATFYCGGFFASFGCDECKRELGAGY